MKGENCMAFDGYLQFKTALDESGFTSGIKKLGNTAASGLKVVAGAVAGVASVMGAGVAVGLKYNASMQDYFSNFETMLGSAEAATQHVAELKEFAAKTPFEMKDLADASKMLLSFDLDVNDVSESLKMLGDVSLGNKEKFSSLALVYGQVQLNGKLMGDDLRQMINAGFNPLQVISEKTGESMASLRDKMSKGAISAEMVAQAFRWATEEGGKYYKGLELGANTLNGRISTLKDAAMQLLGEVVEPITDGMTSDLIPAAIDAVEDLTQAFREDGVDGLIEAGSEIIGNVITGIVAGAPGVIDASISFIDSLISAINDNLPTILNAGGEILLMLISGLLQMLPSLISTALQVMKTLADGLTANMPQITQTAIKVIIQLALGLVQALPYITQAAISIILGFIQGILQMLVPVAQAGWEIVKEFAQGILNSLSKTYEAGKESVSKNIEGIKSKFSDVVNQGRELVSKVVDGIRSVIGNMLSVGREMVENVKSAFNIDWGSIGSNIVRGIANGITSGLGWIVDAARSAANAALKAAKDLLGIHSPSRRSNREIGRPYSQGIAVGFEDDMEQNGIPKMEKSVQESFNHLKSLNSDMLSGSDLTNNVLPIKGKPETGDRDPGKWPIDYERVGKAVADAIDGMSMKCDGLEFGRIVKEVLA